MFFVFLGVGMGVVFNIEITLCMDPSKPSFRTYGHLFCMKTVAKLIIRVMLGLLWVL